MSDKPYRWAMKAANMLEPAFTNPTSGTRVAEIISRAFDETGLVEAAREMMDGYRDAPANLADALRRALARATEKEEP